MTDAKRGAMLLLLGLFTAVLLYPALHEGGHILVTLLLGITIASTMKAENFVQWQTLMIMGLGLVAFIFDTIAGVVFAKILNIFSRTKINPMVGAAGISAFPMSARIVEKMGIAANNQNHLLMHAVGANVSGQIASAVAGGIILGFFM